MGTGFSSRAVLSGRARAEGQEGGAACVHRAGGLGTEKGGSSSQSTCSEGICIDGFEIGATEQDLLA